MFQYGSWNTNRTHQDVEPYERECTPEEAAILEADEAADAAAERAEDEALRDAWFECLKRELPSAIHCPAEQAGDCVEELASAGRPALDSATGPTPRDPLA